MQVDFIFDPGPKKEDCYLIQDNLFAVFDGANSRTKFVDREGRSGGIIASTIAKEEFSKNNADLKTLALRANQKIRQKMIAEKIDFTKKENLFWTNLAAVKINKDLKSFAWAQINDALILIIYKDNNFRLLVEDYDHDQEVLSIWKKYALKKEKNIGDLIKEPLKQMVWEKVNVTHGALSGEPEALKFLKTGQESLKNIKRILLFTDGIFIPKEDPKSPDDFATLTRLFLKGGLKELKNYVRKIEKSDPYCWKYPRYKPYDDLTAVAITF